MPVVLRLSPVAGGLAGAGQASVGVRLPVVVGGLLIAALGGVCGQCPVAAMMA